MPGIIFNQKPPSTDVEGGFWCFGSTGHEGIVNCFPAVFNRDEYQCQKCGAKTGLQAHHLSYKHHRDEINHLGDLVTFCKDCHAEIHGK